jgi:cobalamin biosynthesis Co2+ chelatase CbiK
MGEMYEIMILKKKIEKLQEKINRLRIARRVLMYIIEAIENEKNAKIKALTEEIYRLRKNNKRYARLLFKKNTQQS